jgi:S-adenosylmethionine decarboxylase
VEIKPINKNLRFYGFNNLTKSLSLNLYDICYALKPEHSRKYIKYIDEEYNAERLAKILTEVAKIIGANILNVAMQDYDPQGASVTILIAESESRAQGGSVISNTESPGPLPEALVAHLDKSHITVHTYPENHPDRGVSTFRADIDISTCGQISPLKALNYLIHSFNPDISIIDYRVRGFTRGLDGKKYFIDHKINSIGNYISPKTRNLYQMTDANRYQDNIFHTKMLVKKFDLNNYLFGTTNERLEAREKSLIKEQIKREMMEIYTGRNISNL